jgi:aminoglycoside phosphotransferase family enzyme/predicted kinase
MRPTVAERHLHDKSGQFHAGKINGTRFEGNNNSRTCLNYCFLLTSQHGEITLLRKMNSGSQKRRKRLRRGHARLRDGQKQQPKQTLDRRLRSFLLSPGSYPHRPRSVQLVQTHSSMVFLVAPLVYKIKKAVNLGFLDFSTLEKRCYFCEREVALNRRLCPEVYQGVVPISRRGGTLTFGQGDEVIEYAVKMRKLSERCFLDKRISRREVKPADLDRIVARLNTFYRAQHPTPEIESWGQIDRLRISTDENFRQTETFIGQTLSRPAFEAVRYYTNEFYSRHAGLFTSRVRDKWIRDCHGDLHLEHVHLTARSLHIYDCIEFNDRLRYLDVASDVAFLAMDLDYKGRPDLASHFVKQMASALDDKGMLRLMDFYKCYRAYVRGKVESLQSIAKEIDALERQRHAEHARRYFQWALRYVLSGSRPLALVVMGRIASGKTTLARALSHELCCSMVSSDRVRKQIAGVPLHQRGSKARRARLYSPEITEKTYDKLFATAEETIRRGESVVLDATFARRSHREQLIDRFARNKVAFRFIGVQATDSLIKQRLDDRGKTDHEISDARLEDFEMLAKRYEPPDELVGPEMVSVVSSACVEETLIQTLKKLAEGQVAMAAAQ